MVEWATGSWASDGCLNFFAGPTDPNFCAEFNFYNVHYSSHAHRRHQRREHRRHGRGAEADGRRPASTRPVMITHVGGLDAVIATTMHLPSIPGGKKLIYTNIEMPLTAIDDFEAKGKTDPLFAALAEITARHRGLWSVEAEEYLLANAGKK